MMIVSDAKTQPYEAQVVLRVVGCVGALHETLS
jgi:hypothetical protein